MFDNYLGALEGRLEQLCLIGGLLDLAILLLNVSWLSAVLTRALERVSGQIF